MLNPAPKVSEPVRFSERSALQKLVQQTPLVFAVDAARPDPPAQWELRALVHEAGIRGDSGLTAIQTLSRDFAAWKMLAPAVESLALQAPLVKDAVPAARALLRVAFIADTALPQHWQSAPPAEWVKAHLEELDALAKPQGLLRITVIPAVKELVQWAGGGYKQ